MNEKQIKMERRHIIWLSNILTAGLIVLLQTSGFIKTVNLLQTFLLLLFVGIANNFVVGLLLDCWIAKKIKQTD